MAELSTSELLHILEDIEEDNDFSESESLDEMDLEIPTATTLGVRETADENMPSTSGPRRRLRSEDRPSFQWTSDSHPPEVDSFDDFSSGLHIQPLNDNSTEFEFFQHFLDFNLMNLIVQMTNQFHNFFVLNVPLKLHSRLQRWYDVTIPELYAFFAIMMLMTRNKHLTIEEHWSTDMLLLSPIFGNIMSRNRFCMILGMLHFSRPSEEITLLSKIEKCITHAREKYSNVITPGKTLCIDESIVPFKGRLSIKQYLPNKRNRFGIKLFVLCDVESGIILDFIVYCGATTEIFDPCNLGVGGAVVATLAKKYFNFNRHLYVDNWYTSPALFKYLHANKMYACGTVKKNRAGMPVITQRLQRGELVAQYSPPLMCLKWKDKKDIFMLSSIHDHTMVPTLKENRVTGLPIMKPKAVVDYSKNMGSVDTADMLLSSVQCLRKSIKWYKKLFFHIIDMHLLNSFFCFKKVKNTPNLHLATYQLNVIRQMLENFRSESTIQRSVNYNRNPLRVLSQNTSQHMPTQVGKYQRCKQCASEKKRKETKFTCKICKVYLCAAPCFEKYHK